MDAVDADETRASVGRWSATLTDGHRGSLRLGPVLSTGEIARPLAQVIEMSHRKARQAFVARVAIHLDRPPHQDTGRRAGQGAVQGVRLGQQSDIGFGIDPGEADLGRPVALLDLAEGLEASHQSGQLLARIAGGPLQVAQDEALLRTLETSVLETSEHLGDVRVTRVVRPRLEDHRCRTSEKLPELLQRRQFCFVHIDHHAPDDRSKRYRSDSFLFGNTQPTSDSYHVGKD